MTWLQLYDRIRHQPLGTVNYSNVRIKNEDGTFSNLILKFNQSGTLFWFEKER